MTLPDLIEALQAAEGPSRELDVAILAVCFPEWAKPEPPFYAPHCVGDEPIYFHAPNWMRKRECPELTASLDAATALVERLLPGAFVTLRFKVRGAYHHADIEWDEAEMDVQANNAPSLALALVLAALKAKEASDA